MSRVPPAMTVLCHATAVPERAAAPKIRPSDEEWTSVDAAQSADYSPQSLKEDLMDRMHSSSLITHYTTPLWADCERLGAKRSAKQTALNMAVFRQEADALLSAVSGPAMRSYYHHLLAGHHPQLREVGLTLKHIDNFCEDFRNLQGIDAHQKRRCPIFLAVAARLCGGECGGDESVARVIAASEQKIERLRPLVHALQQSTDQIHLSDEQNEIFALYRLMVTINETLQDNQVKRVVEPPLAWRSWAKATAQATAKSMLVGAKHLNTRAGSTLQDRFPLTYPTSDPTDLNQE
jgi:hypothetical protein